MEHKSRFFRKMLYLLNMRQASCQNARMKYLAIIYILLISVFLTNVHAQDKGVALDRSVQLESDDDVISSVFQDVVVVQRKAKQKEGKFLFSTSASLDFSDGPITMYGFNTNFGYAISNFWEIYLNYTPFFVTNERKIVSQVQEFQDQNGDQLDITYSKPKSMLGLELFWLPAYGKDSWGPYRIVRSDTFFRFGAGTIAYEGSDTGSKYSLMIGKTYFLSPLFNLRFSGGFNYVQTIVQEKKSFNTVAVLEGGLVFYF